MNGREAALLCILLALCLALSAAFKSRAATAEEQPAKLKREARELFRNVVERKTTEPGHCFLADSWLDYPVPEDVARQHLELTIHAELSAPYHGTSPPEVIDPDGAMPQAFCGESEARRQRDTLVESFRRGILKIDKGPWVGTPVAKCMTKEFKKAKVPAFKGDAVTVGKTFTFGQ